MLRFFDVTRGRNIASNEDAEPTTQKHERHMMGRGKGREGYDDILLFKFKSYFFGFGLRRDISDVDSSI